MKIIEAIQKHRDFHTSMVSSFTSDLTAYEDLLLHRIEQSGTYNNLFLVDKRMYQDEMTKLLELQGCQIRKSFAAGYRYSLYPIAVRGAFHPKIYLFLGRNKARMYLGSANVSAAGLGRNHELMFDLQCTHEPSSERTIIKQAFHFLLGFLKRQHGETSLLQEQVDFVHRESPWLLDDEPAMADAESLKLEDGTLAALLLSDHQSSTLNRFIELVGDEPVQQLTIFSPYWDGNLQTLSGLQEAFQPDRTNLLIQPRRTELPAGELKDLASEPNLYRSFPDDGAGFMHAKMILVSSTSGDHLICGSANCTAAALGSATTSPVNAEASIYRRLPAGNLVAQLGLDRIITDEHLMLPEEISDGRANGAAANVKETSAKVAKHPGTVELDAGRLFWIPASDIQPEQAVLILLNEDFEMLEELAQEQGCRYALPAHLNENELMLVQFRLANGDLTAPVFIHHRQQLRRARYKSGNSLLRGLFEKYEQGSPIGLDLLELVQRIESESRGLQDRRTARHAGERGGDSDESEDGVVLPYEEFVRTKPVAHISGNLGLSHAELMPVRDILNRYFHSVDIHRGKTKNVLDDSHLYDEEEAAETVVSKDISGLDQGLPEIDREQLRQAIVSERAQLVTAVNNYDQALKEKPYDIPFQAIDLFKLRLLLEILLSSTSQSDKGFSTIRVLPEYKVDRDTLCHLAGKVLFSFFGGANPAIDRVVIPDGLEGYPVDYLETWACCAWVAKVLCELSSSNKSLETLFPSLSRLAALIEAKTLSPLSIMQRDDVQAFMSRMDERYRTSLTAFS